jgi:hypothetical protein
MGGIGQSSSVGLGSRSAASMGYTSNGSTTSVITSTSTGSAAVRLAPRALPMAWMTSPSLICQRIASAIGCGCLSVSVCTGPSGRVACDDNPFVPLRQRRNMRARQGFGEIFNGARRRIRATDGY